MQCPKCGAITRVTNTLHHDSGLRIRRFRTCTECSHTFRTTQTVEKIDNDGRLWHFSDTRARGAGHGKSVFTDDDIRRMREMWKTGKHTQTELSVIFGCSRNNVSHIIQRKTWAHVA